MADADPAPAGWYPDDEDDPSHRRFWDGRAWTELTRRVVEEGGEELTLDDVAELQRAYGRPVTTEERPAGGTSYEYRLDWLEIGEGSQLESVTADLNALGRQGWELLGLPAFGGRTLAVWKRRVG